MNASARRPGRRHCRSLASLPLAALVFAACETEVLGPTVFEAVPCRPAPALVHSVSADFPPAALRSALIHAAGPMASVFGPGSRTDALHQAIEQLGSTLGARNDDVECRLLTLASEALAEMPDTPATLPDRHGIQLVLGLAARAVAAGQ